MKKEFKIISEFIENNTRVLDVGCGDGILMKNLQHIVGYDGTHGSSARGGTDFFYQMKDITIDAYQQDGVRYSSQVA